MNLTELAAPGEAVGGLAVLITVLYFAYQFRRTSIIERTAGQREFLNRCRDWVELTTTHPDLVNVLRKTLADWGSATPEEQERASGWMLSAGRQAEQALYIWQACLINKRSYKGSLGVAVAIASTPGGSK